MLPRWLMWSPLELDYNPGPFLLPFFAFVVGVYWFGPFLVICCTGLSVLLAPFAGVICAWIALRRGANAISSGLLGAIYSIALLLPWIYLVTRLLGRRMPRIVILGGYVAIYMYWSVLLSTIYILSVVESPSSTDYVEQTIGRVLLFIFAPVAVVSAWFPLHERSSRLKASNFETQLSSGEYRHTPRDLVFIVPFLFAFLASITYLWTIVRHGID